MTFLATVIHMKELYVDPLYQSPYSYYYVTRDAWKNSQEWSPKNKYVSILIYNQSIYLHGLKELTWEDINADDWREYTAWRNE